MWFMNSSTISNTEINADDTQKNELIISFKYLGNCIPILVIHWGENPFDYDFMEVIKKY